MRAFSIQPESWIVYWGVGMRQDRNHFQLGTCGREEIENTPVAIPSPRAPKSYSVI
jgi:hypothetical protein